MPDETRPSRTGNMPQHDAMTGLDPVLAGRIEAALGVRPVAAAALPGGSTVAVLRVDLADGSRVVAKAGQGALLLEAWMLGELARHSTLPLPAVLHEAEDLLLLEHVAHEPGPRSAWIISPSNSSTASCSARSMA
jgi:hypothetical protein